MEEYLHLHGISRRFGDLVALHDIDVTIRSGELVSFVGPSGAGKTTLLRLLAGIDRPTTGRIERARAISREHPALLVFQDYLLFPHMTVFNNVAFGLRARSRRHRLSRREIAERVNRYLDRLGIRDKANAWPAQLSGGQRQRVALARALVMEPGLLLLDEPFANLDKSRKRETARFIRELQQDLAVTTVVVSHDLEEAIDISDRIGVIIDGALRQIGTFQDIYTRPADLAVAELFGPVNRLPVRAGARHTPGVLACARPESLEIEPDPAGAGTIEELILRGGVPHYLVRWHDVQIIVPAHRAGHTAGTRVSVRPIEVFTVADAVAGRESA